MKPIELCWVHISAIKRLIAFNCLIAAHKRVSDCFPIEWNVIEVNQNVFFFESTGRLMTEIFFYDVEIMLKIQEHHFCSINMGRIGKMSKKSF